MEIATEYSNTVYKKDSSGKIRLLHVYTEGADLIQESGVLGGGMVTHRSTCVGKNIGKTNETTPEEQAQLEAQSKIATKMSTGYFTSKEDAEQEVVILPMLAKDYKKEFKKVKFPCYVQPKLDGMRALGQIGKPMLSRAGKEISTMAHIQEEIDKIKASFNLILDGELYAHGYSFQENMKAVKKVRTVKDDPNTPLTSEVKYHVYDLVLQASYFNLRYNNLKEIVQDLKYIKLVPTFVIQDEQELKIFHQKFLSLGYEGTMVRHGKGGYEVNKRSTSLLKYKDFMDLTCKVIDVKPSSKRPEHGECVCEYKGQTFGTGMKFSHAERADILQNKEKYIGQMAEVRFFEFTDEGIPRFPVCVGFRLDV